MGVAPGHACSLLPPRHGLCRYLPRGCGFLCFSAFSSSAFSSSAAVGSRVFPDTGPWVLLLRVKLGRCRSLTASALRVWTCSGVTKPPQTPDCTCLSLSLPHAALMLLQASLWVFCLCTLTCAMRRDYAHSARESSPMLLSNHGLARQK